ncbi:MAG TPA: hypothetical protein DCX89_08685, partial [Saprospirales bacterium]|nr:hypothetical protein [Saprospirales bacterium]
MKKILIFLIFFLPGSGFSQEWSPVGAEWYYDVSYAFSGDIDYHRVFCDSIVEISGTACKRINIDFLSCNAFYHEKIYTFEQNDAVMIYEPELDTFQTLYNFSAGAGDGWELLIVDENNITDTVLISVDSVDLVMINEMPLKRLFVTYTYNYFDFQYENTGMVIQKLGDLTFLANIDNKFYGGCDVQFIHSLRCYQDTEIGFYSTGHRDSCTYEFDWISTDNLMKDESVRLFPNPFTDELKIDADTSPIFYNIFDINGQMIRSGTENVLNLENLK